MSTTLSPAAKAERDRIMSILALPAAKSNRAGAEGLAFGSNATPAEAATALAKAADSKATARKASADNMKRQLGLDEGRPLTASNKSMLKALANQGPPEQRRAAAAKLAAQGR